MAKFHQLKVADVRRETADCISLAFEVPASLQAEYTFKPGQNLTLRTIVDGEDLRRSYSICSAPGEGELRVAIKKIPHGKFSSFANEKIKKGSRLDVMTPTGSFVLKPDARLKRHYVAFAAGSGITPVFSMLKSVLEAEPLSRFTLFYGNKSTTSIIFREAIEGLKNRFLDRFSTYHILSKEKSDALLFNGRINSEKCKVFFEKLLDIHAIDQFLLCGPESMIHEVREYLLGQGVDLKKIHFELFTTPATRIADTLPNGNSQKETDHSVSRVHIKSDGLTFDFEMPRVNESILDAALRHGADLPFACKGGVCTTCKAKLLEGEVRMDVHYGLEEEEIAQGFVLTCQSHPVTEEVTVDYDQAV